MPLEMLSTVPTSVRAIASSQEWLKKLTSGRPEIGIRLVSVSYPEMRGAWARVCEHDDSEFPIFFFHCALELPAVWQRMPKTPTKGLQARVSDAAAAADALAALLDAHQDEIDFHRGSHLTFHHVMVRARTIHSELAGKVAPPSDWSYAMLDHARNPPPTLSDFLRSLGAELRPLRTSSQSVIRPTKVGDTNAERTFMVRSLSTFLNSAFGDPLFDVVATTVNTILDAKDDLLDANHARKLAFDLL
jgi:hypothetical protein